MAAIIPNQNSWIGFLPTSLNTLSATLPSGNGLAAPTAAGDIAGCTNLTTYTISITANAQANTVPTPRLSSLFETNVPGTAAATFSADFYRDSTSDTAWTALPRNQEGWWIISRFGGTGTAYAPIAGQGCEVWPTKITSRAMAAMTSNTAETFTVTASVPINPAETAVAA